MNNERLLRILRRCTDQNSFLKKKNNEPNIQNWKEQS